MSPPDAVVVGAGPNGLVAAATLARAGWDVLVLEAAARPGGGLRTEQLTLPGVEHDVCSAVHPLALASPAFVEIELERHGVRWRHPDTPLAHPLDGGRAAVLHRSVAATAIGLGADAPDDTAAYRGLFEPLADRWPAVVDTVLDPLRVPPRHPLGAARFAAVALRSAEAVAHRFSGDAARALFAGLAGHAVLPLDEPASAGAGLFLGLLGHLVGWPVAEGGSQRIAEALVSSLIAAGGRIECGRPVTDLRELPPARAVLLDLTPRQVLAVAGDALPARYRSGLERFRYGPGVFKVDWTLDGPVPWTAPEVAAAGTVHLGGTFEEIAHAEADVAAGRHAERPYVLVSQPTVVDPTRAPAGRHVLWGYCHVPHGSTVDRTAAVEAQVERFAPGFRDRILARHTHDCAAMEAHDANYVGGDIAGGRVDLRQLVTRPVVSPRPWATPVPGLYLCSSSTPPGPGVHGMCGLHAAHAVLADARRGRPPHHGNG